MYTFDENLISDLHKDAYGFRPSESFWASFAAFNPDQKQALWDSMIADLQGAMEEDRKMEELAISEFEKRIDGNIELGAKSREDAIRWVIDSLKLTEQDLWYGGEYVCYSLGLPYSYAKQFDSVLKEAA